jgi:hypothetical protein
MKIFQFLFRICTILTCFHFIIVHFDLQRRLEEIIFRVYFSGRLTQNGLGVGVGLCKGKGIEDKVAINGGVCESTALF